MTTKNTLMLINLQLFAEGAGEGSAGATGTTTAESGVAAAGTKNPLANVKYGIQQEEDNAAVQQNGIVQQTVEEKNIETDRKAEFEKLIKGDYKDLYGAKVKEAVDARFKSAKEQTEKLESLQPLLSLLGSKYGIDSSDISALVKAAQDDNSNYEQEALQRGMSVENFKSVKNMELENAALRQRIQNAQTQENANKLYQSWLQQAEETKRFFPGFNFDTEMQNPKFRELLKSNIDVKTAFQVLHQDEIIPAAMQYTAKTVEEKLSNNIISQGSRPVENGASSQSSSIVKNDVLKLTKDDRAEIARRVARGEKIRF